MARLEARGPNVRLGRRVALLRKPRKANLEANRSQHWCCGKPRLVQRKSQAKPRCFADVGVRHGRRRATNAGCSRNIPRVFTDVDACQHRSLVTGAAAGSPSLPAAKDRKTPAFRRRQKPGNARKSPEMPVSLANPGFCRHGRRGQAERAERGSAGGARDVYESLRLLTADGGGVSTSRAARRLALT